MKNLFLVLLVTGLLLISVSFSISFDSINFKSFFSSFFSRFFSAFFNKMTDPVRQNVDCYSPGDKRCETIPRNQCTSPKQICDKNCDNQIGCYDSAIKHKCFNKNDQKCYPDKNKLECYLLGKGDWCENDKCCPGENGGCKDCPPPSGGQQPTQCPSWFTSTFVGLHYDEPGMSYQPGTPAALVSTITIPNQQMDTIKIVGVHNGCTAAPESCNPPNTDVYFRIIDSNNNKQVAEFYLYGWVNKKNEPPEVAPNSQKCVVQGKGTWGCWINLGPGRYTVEGKTCVPQGGGEGACDGKKWSDATGFYEGPNCKSSATIVVSS